MRSMAYYEMYTKLQDMMNASFELQKLIGDRVKLYMETRPIIEWGDSFVPRAKEVIVIKIFVSYLMFPVLICFPDKQK